MHGQRVFEEKVGDKTGDNGTHQAKGGADARKLEPVVDAHEHKVHDEAEGRGKTADHHDGAGRCQAHDNGKQGDHRNEYPVGPDLFRVAGFHFLNIPPVDIPQDDGAAGADIRRRRGVNGGDDPQEHDGHDGTGEHVVHQHRHHVAVRLRGDLAHSLENPRAHPLEGREEKERNADDKGGHEHLLPGQRGGGFDPEIPEGECGRRLDAHEGEHVGQDHDRSPAAGAESEVNQFGHLNVFGFKPSDRLGEFRPPAESIGGDGEVAQQNDTQHQQDELDHADPGTGFETARHHIEPDDKRHEQQTGRIGHARHDLEQFGRRDQLKPGVKHGVQDRCENGQPPDGFIVIIIGIHVPRRDKAVPLAHQPVPFGEKRPGDGNGENIERGEGVCKAVTPDQPRVADGRPSGKRRRRRRHEKGNKRNGPPADGVA